MKTIVSNKKWLFFLYPKSERRGRNVTQNVSIDSTEPADDVQEEVSAEETKHSVESFDLSSIPAYNGSPYVVVNDNNPYFTDADYTTKSFEKYAPLDSLGRCGAF